MYPIISKKNIIQLVKINKFQVFLKIITKKKKIGMVKNLVLTILLVFCNI